ncbi:AtpZ/AtpI family protein [soil metagenome]
MDDGDGKPDLSAARDAELARRLGDLERRLDKQQRNAEGGDIQREVEPGRPGYAVAMRLAADFVAGVLLGAAIGWGFDKLVGTSPWGLIVFLLLGFAAGILTVMRSAGLVKPGPADRPGAGKT